MHTQTNKVIVAPGTGLPIVVVNTLIADNTVVQSVLDIRQETQIWTTFVLNPYLRADNIKVFVQDGTATLSGYVQEGVSRELAKQIALGVNGIIQVDNQIVIHPDYVAPVPSSERSYGEMIDDANITAAIKSKLMWSQYSNGLSTDIDTTWCKVTLTGTVDTEAARDLAGRVALNTRGVVSVDNQLEVVPSKASIQHDAQIATQEHARDVADAWISTKVRSTFLYTSNINSLGITVNTHAGIVTLTGTVGSIAERAFAIELAQHVLGVKGVNADGLAFY